MFPPLFLFLLLLHVSYLMLEGPLLAICCYLIMSSHCKKVDTTVVYFNATISNKTLKGKGICVQLHKAFLIKTVIKKCTLMSSEKTSLNNHFIFHPEIHLNMFYS